MITRYELQPAPVKVSRIVNSPVIRPCLAARGPIEALIPEKQPSARSTQSNPRQPSEILRPKPGIALGLGVDIGGDPWWPTVKMPHLLEEY